MERTVRERDVVGEYIRESLSNESDLSEGISNLAAPMIDIHYAAFIMAEGLVGRLIREGRIAEDRKDEYTMEFCKIIAMRIKVETGPSPIAPPVGPIMPPGRIPPAFGGN
jgi:hypothetical protein